MLEQEITMYPISAWWLRLATYVLNVFEGETSEIERIRGSH